MSDGIAKVAGAPSPLRLRGREYLVRPIKFADFATIERHLQSKRPNLLEKLATTLGSLTADVQERVIRSAIDKMDSRPNITAEESALFINSFEGIAYVFWLLMKDQHPEIEKPEHVAELIGDLPIEQLSDLLDRLSGMGDLKKSSGQGDDEPALAMNEKLEPSPAHSLESRGLLSITG